MYLLSWLLFVIAVMLLSWDDARLHHVMVGLLAFPGFIVALVSCIKKRGWTYAPLTMSAVAVIGYLVWWGIEILERYTIDSASGVFRTALVQLAIPRELFSQRIAQGDYLLASYEVYWQLGMPLLQVCFLILLTRELMLPRKRSSS